MPVTDGRMNRRAYLKASGGAIGAMAMAGCLGNLTGGDLPRVASAYVVVAGNKPSLFEIDEIREEVAQNAGEVYELETLSIGSTPEIVSALAAEEIEIGLLTIGSFPRAVISEAVPGGITGVAVDYEDGHEDWHSITTWTTEDSPIESAADLEDEEVAVNAVGTGVQAIFVKQLTNVGLTEDDVNWVEIPFPAMQSALDEGRASAAIVPSTFSAVLSSSGGYRKLFDSHDAFGRPYPFAFSVTRNTLLEEETEAVRGYLEDYTRLVDWVTDPDNRDQLVSLVAEEFDRPEGLFQQFYYSRDDYYHPNPPGLDADGLQFIVNELAELGFIEEAVNVGPHVDNSYLP